MDFVLDHYMAVSSCRNLAVEVLDFEVAVLVANMGSQRRCTGFPSLRNLQRPDCILPGIVPAGSHFHCCTDPAVMVGDNPRVPSLDSIDFAMAAQRMTDCTPCFLMSVAMRWVSLCMTRAKDPLQVVTRVQKSYN